MAPDKTKKIKEKFESLLKEIETETVKIIYINYESGRLKLAYWDEESQHSNIETMSIERN